MLNKSLNRNFIFILAGAVLFVGIWLRFYRIGVSEFLFYDEGMYLGYNREFLNLVAQNPPHSFQEFMIISGLIFKNALGTAKAFWFYLINLRVFIVGPEGYFASRVISAVAGLFTVCLTYEFSRRYFNSKAVGVLSALILFFLPSHIFYSRLGMQESLSTLLFLTALYLYIFSKKGLSIMMLASALIMSWVYFTNYRMIISPLFVVGMQVYSDLIRRQKIDYVKMFIFNIIFFVLILGIGSLYGGINNYVNFGWMTHQAAEAGEHRSLINFLSFPYYIFKLDNIITGLFFFSGFYLVIKRQWEHLLPFLIVLVQMFLFSFAAEKGARYLCVVLPFLAMATAYQVHFFKTSFPKYKNLLILGVVSMFVGFLFNSTPLVVATTDYEKAVRLILDKDPNAKILSTQPIVESLYVDNQKSIVAFPKNPQEFGLLLSEGYRYVIIDPQAYISWTADERRFTTGLIPPLELMKRQLKPVAVLTHIEHGYLERFVLDHNQDLLQSLAFLKDQKGRGEIYIYDLKP